MNAADMLNTSRRFSTALSCLLLMGLMTTGAQAQSGGPPQGPDGPGGKKFSDCLLYTSDAADE